MPDDNQVRIDIASVIVRVDAALKQLDTLAAAAIQSAEDHGTLVSLQDTSERNFKDVKENVDRLYDLVRNLSSALSSIDPSKPTITTKLNEIENAVKAITWSLKELESGKRILESHTEAMQLFKSSCDMCRKDIATKLDNLLKVPDKLETLQKNYDHDKLLLDQRFSAMDKEKEEKAGEAKSLKWLVLSTCAGCASLVVPKVWQFLVKIFGGP